MIERLDTTYFFAFDFIQDSTNKKIADKVNEIIDHINNKETEDK